MSLNPITTYKNIQSTYKKYLKTLFYSRDEYINKKLDKLIEETDFTKGPFLELSKKFEDGKSIQEYIDSNILHKDIKKILKHKELNNLRYHQQEVIEKSIIKNKNIIISTGTGSGKTLSFLIPVINYILNNKSPGVKALFLYPMNALANDQLKDLRIRLKNLPEISFGRYTGETLEKEEYAIDRYKKQEIEILKNERKSREEILKNPPDILITNYSMLEFLLLRPKDSTLFENGNWKYIVLDEIHTYNGAKGSEIGYLIRKLKNRAFKNNKPICIGASATLGDKNNNAKVAKFAQDIFGENFDEDSIIRAKYKKIEIIEENVWKFTFSPNELLNIFNNTLNYKEFIKNLQYYIPQFTTNSSKKEEILYQFLKNNLEINLIKKYLSKEPLTIQELSKILKLSEEEVANLIELSFRAKKDDEELIFAKYHFFVRAADGLYAILNDNGKIEEIFFDKKIKYKDRQVFELSSCKNCGEIFLTGMLNTKKHILEIDSGDETDILRLKNRQKRVYLSNIDNVEYDEDENCSSNNKPIYLNPKTGETSNKPKNSFLKFLNLETSKDIDSIKCCPKCGKHHSRKNLPPINYRFVTGEEFPQSVLLLSLYSSLPQNKKKILVFSDSRKDAAFFAPFFERIYNDAIDRIKIMYILKKEKRKIEYSEMVEDYLFSLFEDKNKIKYKKLLINEFSLKDNKSLENIGLIKFTLNNEVEKDILNRLKFLYKYELNTDEIKALLYTLLLTMREKFAIDDEINIGDALNLNFKKPPAFKKKTDKNYIGWVGNNKRKNFLLKILQISSKEAEDILGKIWNSLTSTEIFSSDEGAKRLKIANWSIGLNDKIYRCNKCNKIHIWNVKNQCRVFNCNGTLYEIDKNDIGEAKYYIDLYESYKEDNNKKLKKLAKMQIEEHSAQISKDKAQEIQKKFEDGKINILSCSTTFELGVDIGELDSVFLHNVPPRPDNYIQRAGRAGRRSNSIAFILTFANRRSHDIKYFANPLPLIQGKIQTPVVSIENLKIIRRHLNSLALAYFLRKNFYRYSKITLKDFLEQNGFKKFKDYILQEPKELKDSIKNILPEYIYNQLNIKNWQWIKDTNNEKYEGCLDLWEKIETEIINDIEEYKNLEQKYNQNRDYKNADKIKKILDYYDDLDIISLFSQKIFIPKYGFPVDTISLDTTKIGLKDVSLDRDMKIAIREYAPDEEVIAYKKLIQSGNMKIIKNKMPQIIKFYFCDKCGYFKQGINLDFSKICPNCGEKIRQSNFLEYITPIFGFEAKKYDNKIPTRKPIPKSKLRSFYTGDEQIIKEKSFSKLTLSLAKRGKITVINMNKSIDTLNGKINKASKTRLGYYFYTDVLMINNTNCGKDIIKNYSLLYALLEGASKALDIKREDIDATLSPDKNSYKIILYDNVPGGAGFMQEIYNSFDEVINAAIDIVKNCKCDEKSCCPVCLEHISNQYLIKFIKRGVALKLLLELK